MFSKGKQHILSISHDNVCVGQAFTWSFITSVPHHEQELPLGGGYTRERRGEFSARVKPHTRRLVRPVFEPWSARVQTLAPLLAHHRPGNRWAPYRPLFVWCAVPGNELPQAGLSEAPPLLAVVLLRPHLFQMSLCSDLLFVTHPPLWPAWPSG